MKTLVKRFAADQSGASAIEYGVVAGLVSVVVIAAITAIGSKLSGKIAVIHSALS